MRHIITLSTIPPRFAALGPALESLVRQRSRPEAVELYIPRTYRRFPEWGGALPEVPEGVTIRQVDEDFGPATKVLHAARAYRGEAVELIYCDDDHVYDPDWAERFLGARKAHPEAAVCAAATTVRRMGRDWTATDPQPRAVLAIHHEQQLGFLLRHLLTRFGRREGDPTPLLPGYRKLDRSGYVDMAEGYAGVALRPDFLDEVAYVIPPTLWAVDDVWLSGQLARRGIPIWAEASANRARMAVPVSISNPLYRAVIAGLDRPRANLACVDHMRAAYGIWGGVVEAETES